MPLSANAIRADEINQYDFTYIAATLLVVTARLLTFAGPIVISKMPRID